MDTEIRVWDGLSPTRSDLSNVKSPDYADYIRIVVELQKLQQTFLNLIQNVALIPNLQGEFDSALARIVTLQQDIAALTPPQELKGRLDSLECALLEQDTRKDVSTLRRDVEVLRTQVDKNQLQVLQLQESFATQVTSFQSRVWNTIKTLDREIRERLVLAEKKLESVSIQTRIQTLLEEFKK